MGWWEVGLVGSELWVGVIFEPNQFRKETARSNCSRICELWYVTIGSWAGLGSVAAGG